MKFGRTWGTVKVRIAQVSPILGWSAYVRHRVSLAMIYANEKRRKREQANRRRGSEPAVLEIERETLE
jgi:hypothetical protein